MVSNNINSRKKFTLLIFILIFALSLFAGCQNKSSQEKEIVELFKQIKKENDIYYPKTKKELQLLVKINDIKLSSINVKDITDMSELFKDSKRSNFSGIETWDTSSVKNMTEMFRNAADFMGGISDWNVSNIENMENMFYDAKQFNADISKWNITNVKNYKDILAGAESFNQNLSNWKVPMLSKKYISVYVK